MDVKNKGDLLQSYFQQLDYMIIREICEKFKEIGSAQLSDVNNLMKMQNVSGGMKAIEYEIIEIMGSAKDDIYNIVENTAREYYSEAIKSQANPKTFESHREILQIVEQTQQGLFGEFIKLMNIENIGLSGADGGYRTLENAYRASMNMALSAMKRGQSSYDEFVSSAVESLTEHGLTKMIMPQNITLGSVNFSRLRTRNAEASFQMEQRYRLVQMTYKMAEILARESGATGFEISYHSGHRPTHTFGGKQFTFAQMKTLGIEDMLNDYNCKHWKFPVIVGVTPPKHSAEELERLEAAELVKHDWDGKQYTLYELGQKKNEYNRKINKVSREIIALDALGNGYEKELQKLEELWDNYEILTDFIEGNEFHAVDRIEGDFAVVETSDGDSVFDVPLTELPEDVKEGDILRYNSRKGTYVIDAGETERRKSEMRERFGKLFGKELPLPTEPVTESELKSEFNCIVTKQQLIDLGMNHIDDNMLAELNRALDKYGITSKEDIAMFLATCAHESKTGLTEVGVGNKYVVNGVDFCGSGFIQLTGKANYQAFADQMLKEGLVQLDADGNNPIMTGGAQYVAENFAWESAAWVWTVSWNNCSGKIAAGTDFYTISQIINAGPNGPEKGVVPNGMDDRNEFYDKAKEIFGIGG